MLVRFTHGLVYTPCQSACPSKILCYWVISVLLWCVLWFLLSIVVFVVVLRWDKSCSLLVVREEGRKEGLLLELQLFFDLLQFLMLIHLVLNYLTACCLKNC